MKIKENQIPDPWEKRLNFKELSFPGAPLIKIQPPGPKSRECLKYQFSHEGSAISYSKGLPMALRRAKGATVEDMDGNVYIIH